MADQAANLRNIVQTKTEYDGAEGQPKAKKVGTSPIGAGGSARVIAITSGKGGVGKTNFAVNLAIAMQQVGKRVIVVDADLGMANVDVVLGTMSRYHMLSLLEKDVELSDVLISGPYDVNYISGGSGIEEATECTYEERELLMEKLSACGSLADIILVDTGAGLGKNVLDFILAADEVLLLSTPEPTSLTDAYAVLKAYSMYAENKNIKLVMNRVYNDTESHEAVRKLSHTSQKFLKLPVICLGSIYEDKSVLDAVRKQQPFLVASPNSVASRCVRAMAKRLLFGQEVKVKRGWKGFLQQFFNFSR